MGAEGKLIIRSVAGAKVAEVTDYLSLSYTKRVNAPGLATFTLPGDHAALLYLDHNAQLEVWRRHVEHDLDWYADFYGFYRAQRRKFDQQDIFTGRALGQLGLLGWRIVAYKAGTAGRSAFTSAKAETVMKALATYNATASGTVPDGRARAAALSGFTVTVQADGANGNTLDWNCAYDNLLTTLQKLAQVGGGDFDLIRTGAATWDFRWYTGQRGIDRTATLTLALGYDNMDEPTYDYDRLDERTAAIVGGKGEGSARTLVVRTGPDYSAANDVETFVDARSEDTTAGLNAKGDKALDDKRARQAFSYKVLQTEACAYGVHYCVGGALGDLVTARYGSISVPQKLDAVAVTYRGGVEEIDVEARNV